ncbi:MAG: hypothetical protein ABL891_10970 [Burkholderiales bacterium]
MLALQQISVSYDHFEHRHRFSVWAAARAAQRAFTSIDNLRDALQSTNIRAFLSDPESYDIAPQSFEAHHRKWCHAITAFLSNRDIANATFGRAAKLIAVYLKAMVVVGAESQSSLAAVIHPPIDRILLQNLALSPDFSSAYKSMWRSAAWTKLNESAYYELLATLRTVVPETDPWWKLEQYWTVTNE